MQVKLLMSRATLTASQNRGEVIEVTPDEAQRMVAAEQAEIVRSAKPEKAVSRAKPEKASK